MKKLLVLALIIAMALSLSACGKKCYDCGKITDKGYTAFGNFYCEDCFW